MVDLSEDQEEQIDTTAKVTESLATSIVGASQ